MNPTVIGIVVFTCTFGAAMGAILLRARLPGHHLSDETKDTVKLGIGLIATMTALVLGLVTASAKSSFDDLSRTIRHTAADLLSLDRALERYGPETNDIRKTLKITLAERIELLWSPDELAVINLHPRQAGQRAEQVAARIRGLAPQTADQRWLQSRALEIGERVLEARWLIFASHGSSIPAAFLATLVFWLTIIFASFGVFAPRNAMVVGVMFVCAVSVAGAVFLILELDGSFHGVIKVSSRPLKYALSHIDQ